MWEAVPLARPFAIRFSFTRSRIVASNPSRREHSWRFHCNASLRHGVFRLYPEPPAKRFRVFSFFDFSGEYAFYFSTGMGTEPPSILWMNSTSERCIAGCSRTFGNGPAGTARRKKHRMRPERDRPANSRTPRQHATLVRGIRLSRPTKLFVFATNWREFIRSPVETAARPNACRYRRRKMRPGGIHMQREKDLVAEGDAPQPLSGGTPRPRRKRKRCEAASQFCPLLT
jgi:hypothetical protein